jgi:hypothetical protein
MALTWNEFLTAMEAVENGSLSGDMMIQVEAFFVTVVGADTPAEIEGLSEADLAQVQVTW